MNLDKLSSSANTLEEANLIITELVSLVKAQQVEIESLKADVEELQKRLGRSSRNSSNAPPSDTPEQRKKRQCKPRSSRLQVLSLVMKNMRELCSPKIRWIISRRISPIHDAVVEGTSSWVTRPAYRHQVFDLPEHLPFLVNPLSSMTSNSEYIFYLVIS